MRILRINRDYEWSGGIGTYIFGVMSELERRGHENVVVYGIEPRVRSEDRPSYFISSVANASFFRPRDLARLEQIIAAERPSVIHIHDCDNHYVDQLCTRLAPTVISLHGYKFLCPAGSRFLGRTEEICDRRAGPYCFFSAYINRCNRSRRPSSVLKSLLRCYREKEISGNYKKILVRSDLFKEYLVENGFEPERIEILPCFTYLPPLEELQSRKKNNTILFSGRISQRKGLHYLLRAVKYIQQPYRLVIVGDGIGTPFIREEVRRLDLSDLVTFAGWKNGQERLQYYRDCSLVALPSICPETFGVVGIEAMAYAKPVVAFDVGGISSWLHDGVSGFLVGTKDISQLAGKINLLLRNPVLARQMGMRGREIVEKVFTPEDHVRKLVSVYEEVIE